MIIHRLEKKIIHTEGKVLDEHGQHKPYLDHLGVPTIGYGATRIFGERITMRTAPISEDQARFLLRHDIYVAMKDASRFIDGFFNIGSVRQEAIVEMAYQLGGPKQRLFIKAQEAGNDRSWQLMAKEMKNSLWHTQTPARCDQLARMVQTNIHPWHIH